MPITQSLIEARAAILKRELAELKEKKKAEVLALKKSKQWVSSKKSVPDEHARAIVWVDEKLELGWFAYGKWYKYNGTFYLTDKDVLEGVTHWMGTDWMYSDHVPYYGPGILNRIQYIWKLFTIGAGSVARDFRPRFKGKNAQLDKKIVYWTNSKGEIRMGLPEHMPASKGFQKVVCNNTHEAEAWSDRLRQYNLRKEKAKDEERDRFEGPIRSHIQSQMREIMKHSRNQINHDFVARYMERMDRDKTKMTREEYLHSEGYEQGR